MEMLESLGNLAGAEFLPVGAFLGFFCKISTPGVCVCMHSQEQNRMNGRFVLSLEANKSDDEATEPMHWVLSQS